MTLTCAIIDDEPLALELLANYVARVPFLKLSGKYTSATQALENIKTDGTQLVFLDIQMPDINGLEFSRILGAETKVVFTTAFSEYAVESYKSQAIDYLLKPIAFADFLGAADKALKWFELKAKADGAAAPAPSEPQQQPAPAEAAGNAKKIYVRSEHKLVGIPVADIEYLEALKDYVMIHVSGRRAPIYALTTMQAMEQALPAGMFMRVHRSYIIALDKIELMEGDTVVVGNKHITVSRAYRPALTKYLSGKTVN